MVLPIITSYRLDPHANSRIPDWVYLNLVQARLWNPNAQIYLITDQTEFPAVEQIPILKTINFVYAPSLESDEVKHFYKTYFPLSINPFFYERACIERWLLIRELTKQNKIDKFFHMDTDVMLFCDVDQNSRLYDGCHLTTLGLGSFGTSHFLHPNVIDDFCKMLLEFYERRSYIYQKGLHIVGITDPDRVAVDNISDMFFVSLFINEYKKSFDMKITSCDDPKYGGIFDCHMNIDNPGVEMDGGHKKIYWFEGLPYSRYINTDNYIQMFCLHFQGGAKGIIPQFFDHAVRELSIHQKEKLAPFFCA